MLELLRTAISPLLSMWQSSSSGNDESGGDNMLRKDLLGIVSCTISIIGRLIRSDLQRWITELYSVVITMIHSSLNSSVLDQNVHLQEDALRVWFVLVRMSNIYDDRLHQLYECVGDIMKRDLEHLR